MKLKVDLVKGQYGNLMVYINDYRVIGLSQRGILTIISESIVDTDKLPKTWNEYEEFDDASEEEK